MSFEMEGRQLQGGMEQSWDKLSTSMCKCMACLCFEHGCAGPADPIIWSQFKFCCVRGDSHSNAECVGPKGMCSSVQKCCCCVQGCHSQLTCTCLNTDILGSPFRTANNADDTWMPQVFWLVFCCFTGIGFTGTDPMIYGQGKFCCVEEKARTTHSGEGGCVNMRSKFCCCVSAEECPPSMDIGIAILGIKLVGGK
mmetsp:Transcript_101455/g.160422  ORF Transcript_101455/g.160422 Transcript_101455/m.160422 type:complete len:196 (+) Transcript_101455:70-657(+)